MKRIIKIILPLFLVSVISACDSDSDPKVEPTTEPVTIVDAATGDGNFTTLIAALEATGLDQVLADPSSTYTVFAPTDAAFELLGEDAINELLDDPARLEAILLYHVLAGEVPAEDALAAAGSTVATANGASVGLSLSGDALLVNTATVTTTDIMTDNGIIHVIDAVLMPPAAMGEPTENIVDTAIASGAFTTLVAALQATGLDATLADESSQFTVFAPTDAAFDLIGEQTLNTLLANPDVLSSILLQHVIAGAAVDSVTAYSLNGTSPEMASGAMIPLNINADSDTLTFGGANVIMSDIYTKNGIIHVIDAVVVADVQVPAPAMTIVDVAVDNGNFTTLVAALQATGLDTVLADKNATYTVFAPTDAAFDKLPEGTVDALLNDTDALSNILLYHVFESQVLADAAISVAQSADNQVTMANGDNAALSIVDSTLFINGATVSSADVLADNGVIHVIDNVILPIDAEAATGTIADIAVGDADFSTLVSALTAAGLVDTLADETATYTVFAPTNAAFDKIPTADLDALLADNDALTAVLLQHVVGDVALSSIDAYGANGKAVDTAGGGAVNVSIDAETGMLMINGAKVTVTDIQATNGVVHVIDTVILD
ncbi:fasciclin domain-containing protein [Thalassotalea maritima]|uniref:fasciclin domain-containing protein n=1 Tax=Thalassotalea maritima TaxID=3242416 RepID=UPI003528659F